MNNRKIKLALTVGLINDPAQDDKLGSVKEIMSGFDEVGRFVGVSKNQSSTFDQYQQMESFTMQFENCSVDLNMISNSVTHSSYVQGFQIR